ncbi:MAG: outer membrane lipoprotein carrier protein LolA [Desulfobacterales bacterium]|nr:MAG: outer membrane lipoprotein carrier protein LolA [Desulfobacterales bacterium]
MKLKVLAFSLGIFALSLIQIFTFSIRHRGMNAFAAESDLTLEQILDRLEKHYTGKSFTAEFGQESTVKAMDITDFATGKMYVRYPGMMRWEYEKPEKQIIVTDGHKLWIYRPDDNQVMTGSAPAFFSDGKGASFLSDITLIRKKFNISLEKSKDDFFYELKLLPLEKTLDVTDIRISVTKNTFTVIRVITYNSYGDENRIELINHKFNAKLDDALFSFDIPEGVDVLQMDK